jgi:hypothetical protein
MAKRKRRASKKQASPQHNLPEGFWQQAAATVLVVVALLLVVAMFGAGGPLMAAILTAGKWLLGWTIYLVPVIFGYIAFETFRADSNRLPFIMQFATVLFLVFVAGFFHLFLQDPSDLQLAMTGVGGGVAGYSIDRIMLALLDTKTSGLVLVVLAFITSLFVLRISPLSVFKSLVALFRRDQYDDEGNRVVAERAAALDQKSSSIGELKMNEGVPTLASRGRHGLKNSMERSPTEEQQSALTIASDPNWKFPSVDLLEKKQSQATSNTTPKPSRTHCPNSASMSRWRAQISVRKLRSTRLNHQLA